MTFGDRVRELRESRKITRPELGKELGINYNTIRYWEENKTTPNQFNKVRVAAFFGVTIGYLTGVHEGHDYICENCGWKGNRKHDN